MDDVSIVYNPITFIYSLICLDDIFSEGKPILFNNYDIKNKVLITLRHWIVYGILSLLSSAFLDFEFSSKKIAEDRFDKEMLYK